MNKIVLPENVLPSDLSSAEITVDGLILFASDGQKHFFEWIEHSSMWEYTLTEATSGLPIAGISIVVSLDPTGKAVVFRGITDTFGQIRASLIPGTYYLFRTGVGYSFEDPEVIQVS
jgi:hypothetical protein